MVEGMDFAQLLFLGYHASSCFKQQVRNYLNTLFCNTSFTTKK